MSDTAHTSGRRDAGDPPLKLGVLASGRGSNLGAILDACRAQRIAAEVAVVLSNVSGAGCLELARGAGVAGEVLDHKGFASREAFDGALVERLRARGVELVCLAGFMRVLTPVFLRAFAGRVINIHPALLPAFPGLHGARQAVQAGVRIAGCTVHFVDEGVDTGPIVMQAAVPLLPGDDEAALATRILEREHVIYPASIDLIARGLARLEGRRVVFADGVAAAAGELINPLPPGRG